MNKLISVIFITALVTAILGAIFLFQVAKNNSVITSPSPVSTSGTPFLPTPPPSPKSAFPPPRFSYNITVLNSGQINTQNDVINVSQGSSVILNLTFTDIQGEQTMIPVESLTIFAYSNSTDYSNWNTTNWGSSINQENVLNYSFSISRVTLQPQMSNSTILTISLNDNAPIGKYAVNLDIGKVTAYSDGNLVGEIENGQTIWLGLIVTPKAA